MKPHNPEVELHPNPLVQYFRKSSSEFNREDIIEYHCCPVKLFEKIPGQPQ